ncbi:hypothetical protein [Gordonia alkanivorans]|uniref:hypothetical protein n=1 Tax=Gordonia alkanivorans TaxID=84096 RepID=UPI001F4E907B|nr:hypothetical protein [Gordonia alkanivorans]
MADGLGNAPSITLAGLVGECTVGSADQFIRLTADVAARVGCGLELVEAPSEIAGFDQRVELGTCGTQGGILRDPGLSGSHRRSDRAVEFTQRQPGVMGSAGGQSIVELNLDVEMQAGRETCESLFDSCAVSFDVEFSVTAHGRLWAVVIGFVLGPPLSIRGAEPIDGRSEIEGGCGMGLFFEGQGERLLESLDAPQ